MEDILLDTDIIIEYLRSKDKSKTSLIKLLKKHNIFLSTITEFELFLGAKTFRHKNDITMLLNQIQVIPFALGCGEIAANIWNELHETHQSCEIRDIFIASIAIFNNIWFCTFNKKHFEWINEIKIWNL